MTTLDQTLQLFQGLLTAEEAPSMAEVDEAFWAYLAQEQGLDAQSSALSALSTEVAALKPIRFLPILQEVIARHRHRLDEPSA